MNQAPSMLKPALISGVAFGVVAAIPFINLINCACCALIIGCGFFAAFLSSKDNRAAGFAFRAGNGATVGLLSGLVYGVVSGVLSPLINKALGMGDWEEVIEQIRASGAEIDPEMLDQASHFLEGSGALVMVLVSVFLGLLFGAIFATIGGLIGGSVFKVEPQPPTQEQAPPPPPVG